ncbi:MAG: hydrogenase 3 maturation endopeptidase HyCI [Candidatus Omnitrophica bacterium]|nr:hydrogenase 3 maturation endopeptidase HyCI [Candidatus Omnitrophota bacterium]
MLNTLTADILELLKINPDSDLIVAVGNSFRTDDGVGPYIAQGLEQIKGLKLINAGYNPENIIEDVIKLAPQKILIIDAADFRGNFGQARIIPEDKIPQTTLSTHAIPLNVISGVISQSIKTAIYFIGIQPESVCLGEGLSAEVKKTADQIIEIIKKSLLK